VTPPDLNPPAAPPLPATSQRDLHDSALLPERTPAQFYRAIALDRLPSFVAEDRVGGFSYLVAAAPVPALGRQAVLSVPLALRQQEIEREITDLNRGVLLGAVMVILLAALFGASVAQRVSDPVERLTRATQQIASGRLDVRIVAGTADELQRLVNDFNSMAATLREQRAELGRTHELKAWADMSRQVAHDIKNPLTPIQLAAEHLQRVHEDQARPMGAVFDQCLSTVLKQVKLLRQIANEFSTFAAVPVPRFARVDLASLLHDVVEPYRAGLPAHTRLTVTVADGTPDVRADRTLVARALTNLVENAVQALPSGGLIVLGAVAGDPGHVHITCTDTGAGMSAESAAHAFDPHFSTKTGGSGLGLANARRNVELCGGTVLLASEPGRGTRITLALPVAGPPGAESA
jgi:nitrogen fixation/metabolism regulation signal transduction histidine kinase